MKLKNVLSFLSFCISVFFCSAQKTENIIIITTDGLRWQDVFKGMDSAIANNSNYYEGDSNYIFKNYWDNDETARRKKLMPFLWNTINAHGQIYGNRSLGNKVNNANPFWFSYPGYSEIMTGFADTTINSNEFPPNHNATVLEYFNQLPKIKGKVAAFAAWDAFDRILNEKRSGIPVINAFDKTGGKNPNANDITTDHGRGDINKKQWTDHGQSVEDASQIWFAVMGPEIAAKGEMKNDMQLYQDQFAQTIARLMGYTYKGKHPISPAIKSVLNK